MLEDDSTTPSGSLTNTKGGSGSSSGKGSVQHVVREVGASR
jgi:hypothetical protein